MAEASISELVNVLNKLAEEINSVVAELTKRRTETEAEIKEVEASVAKIQQAMGSPNTVNQKYMSGSWKRQDGTVYAHPQPPKTDGKLNEHDPAGIVRPPIGS